MLFYFVSSFFVGAFNLLLEFEGKYTIINLIKYVRKELVFSDTINNSLENIYDTIQIALNKKEIDNFIYYRDLEKNSLIRMTRALDAKNVSKNANKINKFNKICNEKNIPYIFVNTPEEVKDIEFFKNIDYSNAQTDLLLEKLDENVNVINLREYDTIINMHENFYKTDHHMNIETAFEAFKIIMDQVQNKHNIEVSQKYFNVENYTKKVIPNCFYGSKGLNAGTNYIPKEDFILYIPKYNTDFHYRQINNKGEEIINLKGRFEEALINNKILEDYNYINKYNVFLYTNLGQYERIIINNNADNNKKLLLISSSYGRQMAPYLSQCFYETRYIDPRDDRFKGDILEYINNYSPDIIIMLYDANSDLSKIKIN